MGETRLALKLIRLAQYGTSRCGAGFGKYPFGVRDAIEQLRSLVAEDDPARPDMEKAIAKFDDRLSRV